MKILNKMKKKFFKNEAEAKENNTLLAFNTSFSNLFNEKTPDNNVVYYTCLKILSESLGKLTIHLKDENNKKINNHETNDKLKYKPNNIMNATIFFTLLEYQRNHFGNAYVYIKHGIDGKLEGLYPLYSNCMSILIDNANIIGGGIKYQYSYKGKNFIFDENEIIHLKGGISENGILGISIREKLASTLQGITASQNYLNNLYERGLTAKGVLKYTGDLNEKNKKELIKKIETFMKDKEISDFGILPMPFGMELVPLDLKLTDSQFFELKKYTALQIAGAFGIKPNQLNDYEKSSYANAEMQNLTFYIDTLLYILKQYEEEFTYKLLTEKERMQGLRFEFNVASLLRGDLKTQAECITKYITNGVYTINEARGYAGLEPIENGDVIVMNGSYVPLEKLGVAYDKGGGKDE
ncbi:MAG: phage portal protein [Fusobacterium gastrosuis]|uniref:phage portal protein n=1 Tax=Fusobacterium gastrosuis TaxID=1755100 RepID=UPI002A8DCC20|nr:phage portal protein [Fusobacterium gastrosuis]